MKNKIIRVGGKHKKEDIKRTHISISDYILEDFSNMFFNSEYDKVKTMVNRQINNIYKNKIWKKKGNKSGLVEKELYIIMTSRLWSLIQKQNEEIEKTPFREGY